MKKTLGLIETSSISKGMEILDIILKETRIVLITGRPICPGKYLIIIEGTVQSISFALEVSRTIGGKSILYSDAVNNLSEQVFCALKEKRKPDDIEALGIIETRNSIASIVLADVICDSANVELITLKLANGIGGKGLLIFAGNVSSVRNAIQSAKYYDVEHEKIIESVLLSNPDHRLIDSI